VCSSDLLVLLCYRANIWFSFADKATKRRLVKLLYSNPRLKDKKALLIPKKPLVEVADCVDFPRGCSVSDAVRTKGYSDSKLRQKIGDKLAKLSADPEVVAFAEEAKTVIRLIDPDALKEGQLSPRSVE